jgi:hypothetical protein
LISQRLQRFQHASPIGRWSVTVCRPDPPLADFVLKRSGSDRELQ